MTLIERLTTPVQRTHRGKSIMDVWVASRPETEQQAILTAAVNPEWGHVALRDLLAAEGAPELADTSFRAWRRKVGLK